MNLNTSMDSGKTKKRKKKRSAYQMAKKFARSRDYRGQLDNDTYQYGMRILEIIRDEFPQMDHKDIFVNNIFQQIAGREVEFAQNQVGSRVFDTLIEYANFEVIFKIYEALSKTLRPLCNDKFASFVIQKLICMCAIRGNLTESESGAITVTLDERNSYNDITLKLCKYLINNIEEFISDPHANHIIRTCFLCLSGLLPEYKNVTKNIPDLNNRRKVIENYNKYLLEAAFRISKMPQFLEFCHNELTSGFVQVLLYSLKDISSDINSVLIRRIQTECFTRHKDDGELSNIFKSSCSLRLLEACLTVATPLDYEALLEIYFKGFSDKILDVKDGNFCLEKLIENCPNKEAMEKVFEDLLPHWKKIFTNNHLRIFTSMAKTCLKLKTKQGPFIKLIGEVLNINIHSERQLKLFQLIATMKTFEDYEQFIQNSPKIAVTLNGSLILQSVLKFNKPIKVISSFLSMSKRELVDVFCDPKGSRIMDAFMESEFVGEKSREKLAKCLQGTWGQLVCDVYGSRSFEKVWQWAGSNQKIIMMEELLSLGQTILSSKPGRIIASKLNMQLYARNKKEWIESHGKERKTKIMFAGIIGNT